MVDRVVKELRQGARENPPQMMSAFVFPGLGRRVGAVRKDQPIYPSSLRVSCLWDQMNRRDITVHGFRSTFKDWCHEETNFPSEVIKMAMGHAIDNQVEAAYRRGDLFKKRHELMEAWANFCDGSTADVIALPLRERRSQT